MIPTKSAPRTAKIEEIAGDYQHIDRVLDDRDILNRGACYVLMLRLKTPQYMAGTTAIRRRNFTFFTMHRDPEDVKVEANGSQGYTANTDVQGMSLRTGGLAPYSLPSTGPPRLVIDFSVPNPHLYDGPSDRLPPNWSNVWEDFPFCLDLFPLVNGRIFASLDIELHNHVSGEIYFIMYNERSEEAVIRIGTRYFVYHFETDMLLEFLHTYLTLDAFLDLATQWEGTLTQAYTLTPFVQIETDVTPDNYYEEVERWKEVEKARAAHALMNSRQL